MTDEELKQQVQFADGQHCVADLLEKYRPYLRLLATRQLDVSLATRLSASDIVQQTQLEAFRDCGLFRGQTEEEFVGWLKAILSNNVAQATHVHIVAKKRTVKREQALAADSQKVPQVAEGKSASPSATAMQVEAAVILAKAMERLGDDQYEAVRLRYFEGASLAVIAEKMNRSQSAVAGLLKRGLRSLRGGLTGFEQ